MKYAIYTANKNLYDAGDYDFGLWKTFGNEQLANDMVKSYREQYPGVYCVAVPYKPGVDDPHCLMYRAAKIHAEGG